MTRRGGGQLKAIGKILLKKGREPGEGREKRTGYGNIIIHRVGEGAEGAPGEGKLTLRGEGREEN